jgi:hypothetical protein
MVNTTEACRVQYNKLTDQFIYSVQFLIICNSANVLCDGTKNLSDLIRKLRHSTYNCIRYVRNGFKNSVLLKASLQNYVQIFMLVNYILNIIFTRFAKLIHFVIVVRFEYASNEPSVGISF